MVDVGFPSTAPRFLPVQRKMRTPAPSRSPKSMSASGSASCISDSAASELSSEVPNPPKRQKQQQKQRASPEPKDGSSRFNSRARNKRKFVGVRQRPSGRWVAEIKDTTQKIRLWLGTFNTAEDAARAYDEAACLIRGANTRTNFVSSSNFDTGHLRSKAAQTLLLSRGITSIASKGGKNIVFPVKRENEVITQEDTPVISQGISNNSRMEEDEGSVCLPSSSSGSDCALDSSSPIAQTSSPFVRHDDQKNLEQHFDVSKSPAHDSAFDGLCKEEPPVLGCWDSWPSDRKKEPFIGHRHEGKLGYSFYSPDAYASDALSCWGEKTDNSFEGSYSSPFDFCAEITLPNTFDEIPLMPGLHSEQEPMMDFELPEDNLKEHIKRVKYEKQSLASLFVMNSVQERLLPRSTSTATVPVPSPTSFTSSSSSSCTSSGFNQSSQKVYYPVPHRSSSNDASPVEAPSSKSAFSKEDNNSGSDCSSQEPLLWDLAPFCVGDIYRFDR